MRKKIVRRRRPLALLTVVLTVAAVAVAALLLGGGTASAQPEGVTCTPVAPQAEHRLQLNTVTLNPTTTDPLAKTVAMEKDIYECRNTDGLVGFRDLETFVEIVERTATPSTPTVVTVDRRVDVTACDKFFASGVKCAPERQVDLGSAILPNPLAGCDGASAAYPPDVQMNTVALGNNLVKTIKVDKEVFTCGDEFRDVYLFTEILERLTAAKDNVKPYARVFEGIVCNRTTDPVPTVTLCIRFATS